MGDIVQYVNDAELEQIQTAQRLAQLREEKIRAEAARRERIALALLGAYTYRFPGRSIETITRHALLDAQRVAKVFDEDLRSRLEGAPEE